MGLLKDILINLTAGMIVGAVFAFIRLPVPAPNAIPPVMGILGITMGFMFVTWVLNLMRY